MIILGQNNRKTAKNFRAVTMTGKTVELSSLKGKVVVLTFWTTRCQVCHEELPKLNRLADQYRGQNVVFLGLTTDNETKVEKYLKKNRFNYEILPNTFGVLLQYAENDNGKINMGYPTHFLVNQKGEIEFKTSGFAKTEKLSSGISNLLSARSARAE
jgi:peroxiredoxin